MVIVAAALTFALGSVIGCAAFVAAWSLLLPSGLLRPELADDRSIASYLLLFGFHILNAIIDQWTGLFRDARKWEQSEKPDSGEYRLMWSAYLGFWTCTHAPLAVTGAFYFMQWCLVDSVGLSEILPLPTDSWTAAWVDVRTIMATQFAPAGAVDTALRAVSATAIAVLSLYAGRVGVVVPLPSAPRIGLRRLTDQPLWIFLSCVMVAEATRALSSGIDLVDSRALVPLLVATFVVVGGTHQNARYAAHGQRWLVPGADLRLVALELLLPIGFSSAFAVWSVGWYVLSGCSGFLCGLQGINLLATFIYLRNALSALCRATASPLRTPPPGHPFVRLRSADDEEAAAAAARCCPALAAKRAPVLLVVLAGLLSALSVVAALPLVAVLSLVEVLLIFIAGEPVLSPLMVWAGCVRCWPVFSAVNVYAPILNFWWRVLLGAKYPYGTTTPELLPPDETPAAPAKAAALW